MFIIPIQLCFGQNEGNNWYFGTFAGIDFNGAVPVALTNGALNTGEGCSSVSDSLGNLLLYTDGVTVWNKNHVPMPNGGGLLGDMTTSQHLILKQPGNNDIFYVFTLDFQAFPDGFRYTEVDIQLQGGLGDVNANKNILVTTPASEKITAIEHQNGQDYWVIIHRSATSLYYCYLLSPIGFNTTPVVSSVGTTPIGATGCIASSMDGKHVADARRGSNEILLMDFDNSTGILSNGLILNGFSSFEAMYGVEFSPNNRFLYGASINAGNVKIYQYDLLAGSSLDISNSKTISGIASGFGALQLGPDGKIYHALQGDTMLGVIENPNYKGVAANYQAASFNLGGKYSRLGLPNFPNQYFPSSTITAMDLCFGDSTRLISFSTQDFDSLVWNFDDPGSGSNNFSVLPSPKHLFTNTGVYNVQLIFYSGTFSDTTYESIYINPLPTLDLGVDTSICIGDSIQINVTGALSYLWTPNSNINDDTIANPVVFPAITTSYFVNGTDTNGCINSDSIIINVNLPPIITTNNDTTVCIGTCVQLFASGGNDYLWTQGNTLSDSIISNPIACPTMATTYLVTVTDSNNCIDTSSLSININPLSIIDAGPDLWVCSGDSIQLNVNGGVSYLWTPSSGLNDSTISNPIALPLDTTIYFVTGTDTKGCAYTDTLQIIVNDDIPINSGINNTICAGDSILLGGNPTSPSGTSFSWFPNGGTLDNDTLPNPTAFPLVTTTYYIVANNDTCTSIDSITITVNQLPNITGGNDLDVCIGDSIQINATGALSYLWTPNSNINDDTIANPVVFPTITTSYFVNGTDTNGCINSDSIIINVNLPPIITTNNDTTVCIGTCVQLFASGGNDYLWTQGNTLSDSIISNPIACPTMATTYLVTVTDSNNCIDTSSLSININPLSIIDAGPDLWVCSGDSIQLNVNGGVSYLWTPSSGLNDSIISNPITTTQITITYQVSVTDSNGCIDTTSILINAEPKPMSDFVVYTTPSCDGVLVEFTNLSTGATSYSWDFNDGDQSNEMHPIHTFQYSSLATVVLTSYSQGVCIDTSSYPITSGLFEDYFNLTPPTILTPNNDGINDVFRLDLPDGIEACTNILIFNRWGTKVFESNNQNTAWNGKTSSGNMVSEGTYFYIVDINGVSKKGSITLVK